MNDALEMRCIAYVSSAVRPLTDADMEHLLENSRARNLDAEVTGLLLHRNGNFMQYIEGPSQGIDQIYRIIQHSPLHRDIIEIVTDTISARLFPHWSMAYRRHHFQSFSRPDDYARTLHPDLYQPVQSTSPIIQLLNDFWNGPTLTGRP